MARPALEKWRHARSRSGALRPGRPPPLRAVPGSRSPHARRQPIVAAAQDRLQHGRVVPVSQASLLRFGEPRSRRGDEPQVHPGGCRRHLQVGDPARRAAAIVKAITFHDDPDVVAKVSDRRGPAGAAARHLLPSRTDRRPAHPRTVCRHGEQKVMRQFSRFACHLGPAQLGVSPGAPEMLP